MKKTNRKKGFSLAEGMVMLVIVSVLMALAAPLIVKRSQADSRTLWLVGAQGRSITGGVGQNQKVGIGANTSNPANPNVKVQINKNLAGMGFLTVGPFNNGVTNVGLNVNASGETNIVACVPDWNNATAYNVGDATTADGYLAINSECVVVNNLLFCPPINVTSVDASRNITRNYTGAYVLIPVRTGAAAILAGNITNKPAAAYTPAGGDDPAVQNFFVPCAQGHKAYEL